MSLSPASVRWRRGSAWRSRRRAQVLERHGLNCWLCAKPIASAEVATIDHVKPLSKGGNNKIGNLRPAHRKCNQRRGDGPIPELLLTKDMIADQIGGGR